MSTDVPHVAHLLKASRIQRSLRNEGAFFHPSIDVSPIREMGGGYGIVAHEYIPPGTLIVSIPRSSMITALEARKHLTFLSLHRQQLCREDTTDCCGQVIEAELARTELDVLESSSPGSAIIFALLVAAFQCGRLSDSMVGPESDSDQGLADCDSDEPEEGHMGPLFSHTWMREWILSLPARYDNLLELRGDNSGGSPEKWKCEGDAYLQQFLCFRRHREKVLEEQDCVIEEFRTFLSLISTYYSHVSCEASKTRLETFSFTLEQFTWAYNTLMSRAFAYDSMVWAVMPWVDYFNHSTLNNATMRFDKRLNCYVFVTVVPIAKGEQIFLQYGSYTDAELLLWYGFTVTPSLFPSYSNSIDGKARIGAIRMILQPDNTLSGSGDKSVSCLTVRLSEVYATLGHCFSPWAKADGSSPNLKDDCCWLEDLFALYEDATGSKAVSFANSRGGCKAACAAAELAGVLNRKRIIKMPRRIISHDCVVRVRGPSRAMLQVLKHVSDACRNLSGGSCLTPSTVLRAICWAELVCSTDGKICGQHLDALSHIFDFYDEPEHSPSCSAGKMARQVSLDIAYLLYFLSVEATDRELRKYLLHTSP
ncbi:unnamed protein product [Trypanosoma congolense IL3000]|uniref:WGS project CAEQ00000000 data, annotated contig 1664 n=1 Tax=Trypanosoma congolense (strain IL3000) TaxID=1068625 RepID=F9W7W5_TRYCI|nr:unnamed protein product [Trypanosoma congolense IL3000]